MTTGRYRFTRDDKSIEGHLSRNEPSANALNALSTWSNAQQGRGYDVEIEEDQQLVANLSWKKADSNAGPDLDNACIKRGVKRYYLGS